MEKEYLEIILEDINSKFDTVLEGHQTLRQDIADTRNELTEKINFLDFKIDTVNEHLTNKIDGVEKKLSKRIDDIELSLTKRIDNVETTLSQKIDTVATDLKAHRNEHRSSPDLSG